MNHFTSKTSMLLLLALPIACGDDGAPADGDGSTGTGDTEGMQETGDGTSGGTGEQTGEGPADTESGETSTSTTSSSADTTDGDDSTTGEPVYELQMELIGRYESPDGEGAAEISAFDPESQRLFVTNGATGEIDALDLSDPTMPVLDQSISLAGVGGPTSVAVQDGVLAVAVEAAVSTAPGSVQFFATDDYSVLSTVTVGSLPDMVTFSPDGNYVLVANEGEPSDDYLLDPEGSVSIIDISGGVATVGLGDVVTAGFGDFTSESLDDSVRIFGPNASVAQDLEPEYITVSADSSTAWVTLQENNAVAVVDLAMGEVTEVVGLGFKDHSVDGSGMDASNADGAINISTWPVFGMFQPDAIASFEVGGETFLITANEGDAREYESGDVVAFAEEVDVQDVTLDPAVFPDAATLQGVEQLGNLKITNTLGNTDEDDEFEELYAFGGRSVSIWTAGGQLVWDSGDSIEQQVATAFPDDFNSTDDENDSFDDRSDNKGPEPEGVVVAEVFESTYAFVGLERMGGIMVFDVADPENPQFVLYRNDRDFEGVVEEGTAGDLAPEGLVFIAEADSPTGEPLLVVSHEVSGTVAVYQLAWVEAG